MTVKAFVGGAAMIEFRKPGDGDPYDVMGGNAVRAALADAGIGLDKVQQAYASYIYGDSACGQKALYEVGLPGIPIFNVNNNCSSGSSAIFLARQAVEAGMADCVLAFGFEQMQPGALKAHWDDRVSPGRLVLNALFKSRPNTPPPGGAAMLFGSAGFEYLETYGATPDLFAKVAVKSRRHAAANPYALFTKPLTVEDVMASPVVYGDSLHRLMCCPPTCGAAAVIIVSEKFAKANGISRLVEIAGQGMATDTATLYDNARNVVGQDYGRRAANIAYEAAGIGPEDADLVELHDCFTPNEVITYEALGLCGEGEATRFVDDGDNTYGGKIVVNPSGGLMSKGHPIGATGVAQCVEIVWHLRGDAGQRQVEGARIGLQHNIGVPGAAVVTIYKAA
ncbi:MAG: lipid-transfer protein [Sphingomonas sp.]|nr:lipid-transfer protein [Sphingomonas sp.]